MTLIIKKRGRPTKEMVAARVAATEVVRSDEEILADLKERFRVLGIITEGTVQQNVRAATVTGAPGVGKTFTVEKILAAAKEKQGINYEIIRGTLSAINLYKMAYKLRKAGSVLVLDDADGIFNDEDALNILKALCDSSEIRRVHWLKESQALKDDDVPQSFEFEGSLIFISNLDFQKYLDMGGNKYSPHFEALMSRSLYLDLRLHTKNELGVWVEHVAQDGKIFRREGLTETQGAAVMQFIRQYRNDLRELSLRTLLKASQLVKIHDEWESVAKILLLKTN